MKMCIFMCMNEQFHNIGHMCYQHSLVVVNKSTINLVLILSLLGSSTGLSEGLNELKSTIQVLVKVKNSTSNINN
jgi:hypothetical protein